MVKSAVAITVSLHPQIPRLGSLLYTEGFQASEGTLHYLPIRRPDFHWLSHVTVVPISGLLMAVTSGMLSGFQAKSY